MSTINVKTFIIACFKPLMWALRNQSDDLYNQSLSSLATSNDKISAVEESLTSVQTQMAEVETTLVANASKITELSTALTMSDQVALLQAELDKQKILYDRMYAICQDLIDVGSTTKILPDKENPFVDDDEIITAYKASLGHDADYILTVEEQEGYGAFRTQFLADNPDRIYYSN